MSTRSCIYVFSDDFAARLYRHMDGYPSANLPAIAAAAAVGRDAKTCAQALVLGGEGVRLDWVRNLSLRPVGVDTDDIAAAVQEASAPVEGSPISAAEKAACAWIGGWIDGLERNIRVAKPGDVDGAAWEAPTAEQLADFPIASRLSEELLGNQGDLEWIYFVDVARRNVNVYHGNDVPALLVDAGVAHPMAQLDDIMEQYKEGEARGVGEAIASIVGLGWTLNRFPLGIEEQCAQRAKWWRELDEMASLIPSGYGLVHAQRRGDGEEERQLNEKNVWPGEIIKVGESWALQKVDGAKGPFYAVHELAALGAGIPNQGAVVEVGYGPDGRAALATRSARRDVALAPRAP